MLRWSYQEVALVPLNPGLEGYLLGGDAWRRLQRSWISKAEGKVVEGGSSNGTVVISGGDLNSGP